MGTAKFDDGIPSNPKLIAAGASASWLWLCGVLFCRRGLTDGFIPRVAVPSLVIGLTSPYKHAERLVDVGLWHVTDGGYTVNGFLEWNPSKDAMSDYRKKDRERKQRQYGIHLESARNPDGIHAESDWNPDGIRTESARIPYARGTHAGAKSESESERSRSALSRSEVEVSEESARGTSAIAPVMNRNGRTPGLMANIHRGCFMSDACGRGICVPSWLATEWRQQHGTDVQAADVAIRGVIEAAVAVLPPGPIGDEPKAFWRAVWRAAHGSQAPTTGSKSKGQITLDAARRFVLARTGATP